MDNEKAIRAAKLTLGGLLEKRRAGEAKDRAPGQIAPSKYLPGVPRAVHAAGGRENGKRDFTRDNPGGEWLEGKQARAAQYPNRKFVIGPTTGVIGGRSDMFLPTHILKGIAGLNDEVRTAGVHKYDSLLSDAQEGGFDHDQKGNKVVVAVNHYGQPYLLEGNTRVAVAHSLGIPKVKAEVRYWNGAEKVDGPMHPDQVFGMASDSPDITKAGGGPVTDNDNFQSWFGNSVTHTDGQPHVFYTGTSKDKDFTSFNIGRHGAWFTRDPEVASLYADTNDSQGYKQDGWDMVKTNTASRVIPAYVRAENPYTGELPQEYMRDNYKAAQSDWFDTLRAKGHDAWMPSSQGGNLVVALKEPQQIKSIYNKGTFDPGQKHMNKTDGGAVTTKTKDGSGIFGNGALIHRYTHPETGGYIDVLQRPQGPASVLGLEVPEEHRGKGIGQMLQANALERHPSLMGQVSSKAAATTAYRLGRRPFGAPDATLNDVFSTIDRDSSVNMLSPQAQPKADGGAAGSDMFQGIHPTVQDEQGAPMDLYHGTPGEPFNAFDDKKPGERDAGFFGKGHYLTPIKGNAEGYADPDEMGKGSVMGPLHAALKNPYVWDTSSDAASHRTLRDLQGMGIMRDKQELNSWDNLQRHHMDAFMGEMKKRGHDGVVVRTKSYDERPHNTTEIVVFKPSDIKHKDAEVFDPNDPNIYRAAGGVAK
jgi:hypothetical protein